MSPHFDDQSKFSDSESNLKEWHRFGKSPAGNLINWSLRNSTAPSDVRYNSTGVRYLATNCGAGSDSKCSPGGTQAIYQDLPISMFTNNATYGYGVNIRTEGGTGTYQAVIQEIDNSGNVLWQDVAQDTNITSDNGPDQQADQSQSVYLSSKFVGKTVTIPVLPGAAKMRFLLIPVTANTFDVLDAWLAPWPVASQNLTLASAASASAPSSLASAMFASVASALPSTIAAPSDTAESDTTSEQTPTSGTRPVNRTLPHAPSHIRLHAAWRATK